MSLLVLHYRCPAIDDVMIARLPPDADRVKASAYVSTLDENRGACIIESADDLSKMSGPLLVKIYNELMKARAVANNESTYVPIKKFESLIVGRPRVYREITHVAANVDPAVVDAAIETVANTPEPAPIGNITAGQTEPEHVPTVNDPVQHPDQSTRSADQQPKEATMAKTKRKSKIDPASKIYLLAEENPKREKSAAHKRFALYRNGMLVSTFLEKGGTGADLAYDVAAKYIKIEKP